MFKMQNISSSNLTHHNNKWPNHSFSKVESEKDSVKGLEVEEEDLVEEEDEVVNQSSATPMGYLGIIRGSSFISSVHTVRPVNIMFKIALS